MSSRHYGQAIRERKSKRTRRLAFLTAASLGLGMLAASVLGQASAATAVARTSAAPANACSALTSLKLTNTTVVSATEDTSGKFTIPSGQPGAGTVLTSLPAFCAVALIQANPPAHDQVHVEVWLPLTTWDGDFQGVGGGSFVAGISWSELATAIQSGYSTASTDTGDVEATMGTRLTRSFARLFLAPGAGHCGLYSAGPVPANPFGVVVNWVQNGTAPSTILATTVSSPGQVVESRPLCAYPDGARYTGHGNLTEAQNFVCAPTFTSQRRHNPR